MKLPHPPHGYKFAVTASIAGYRYRIALIPTNQDGWYLGPASYMAFFDYRWQASRRAKQLLRRFHHDRDDAAWARKVSP